MILYKQLSAKEVLEAVAYVIGQQLPDEVKDSEAEINVSFGEDNCVEVYLINVDDEVSSN